MPGYDRKGPDGYGPKTGRALGPCGSGQASRRCYGRGFRGRGFGRSTTQPVELTKEQERKILEAEKQEIETKLKELEE